MKSQYKINREGEKLKKIMVYAYTNFNLGDDLFIKVLCERYPNTNFVLYAPSEYKKNFQELNNITYYSSDSIFFRGINFICRKFKLNISPRKLLAKNCDAVVHIGGSIFMQGKKWKRGLKNREKIRNKPFFLLGANFGPYEDNNYYKDHKNLFKEYTDICFREKYSYDLFKDLPNVRMADDVIFQLKTKQLEKDEYIVISVIKPSIRKHLEGYDEIYYQKIKDITKYFTNIGYNIILMSFCENEGDGEAIEEIFSLLPACNSKKVSKYLYRNNIDEALNILGRSCFIIGTRFHAMILGWVNNIPVFPIAYSDKMINVMNDINFQGYYTDFNNIHKLEAKQVFKSMKKNNIDVSKQVINAEKHFEKLDDYLLK